MNLANGISNLPLEERESIKQRDQHQRQSPPIPAGPITGSSSSSSNSMNRSVLPPMSRSPLPPMSNRPPLPPPQVKRRPGAPTLGGRMGNKPALNLSQLGLAPKPDQTPFANFSKYVYVFISLRAISPLFFSQRSYIYIYPFILYILVIRRVNSTLPAKLLFMPMVWISVTGAVLRSRWMIWNCKRNWVRASMAPYKRYVCISCTISTWT